MEIWINRVVVDMVPDAVTLEEVQRATEEDEQLMNIAGDVQKGRLRA